MEDIVKNKYMKFRDGVPEFFDFLNEHNIPLVIMSTSGCGDAVRIFFQYNKKDYPNTFYVTNMFKWDEKGKAISAQKPIIHSMNKDETILSAMPKVNEVIKKRRNVLLLGDGIGDLGMIKGFNYGSLLTVGFLNPEFNKDKEEFEKNFDIVLEGDGDFKFVNKLIKELE